ncbi:hypothetical protein CEE45_05620 [Candidatus Heimdallarchaeota archaeon B3_Heim]|nr:MAG: hypothetical protein CEE45_05620 [Candidatus Heimdallarchaeota archaeon B3_Heim]
MLRSEFPFKISVVSSPDKLAESMLQNYRELKPSDDTSPPSYEIKMDVSGISVRLHIKQIQLGNKIPTSRMKEFQGSIGMIYIFENKDLTLFNEVKTDYYTFEHLYKTVNIQPVFLGVGNKQDSNVMKHIHQTLKEMNHKLDELEQNRNNSFTQLIRSVIIKSKSFQSTTQGSCDINLE